MAYIDYTSISIDHIVSAILYYYRDNEPDNPITKLYPANVYAGRLRKKNDTKISFTNFSSENVSYSFAPNITPDVKVLFSTLRNETLQISVPLIFGKFVNCVKNTSFRMLLCFITMEILLKIYIRYYKLNLSTNMLIQKNSKSNLAQTSHTWRTKKSSLKLLVVIRN